MTMRIFTQGSELELKGTNYTFVKDSIVSSYLCVQLKHVNMLVNLFPVSGDLVSLMKEKLIIFYLPFKESSSGGYIY